MTRIKSRLREAHIQRDNATIYYILYTRIGVICGRDVMIWRKKRVCSRLQQLCWLLYVILGLFVGIIQLTSSTTMYILLHIWMDNSGSVFFLVIFCVSSSSLLHKSLAFAILLLNNINLFIVHLVFYFLLNVEFLFFI